MAHCRVHEDRKASVAIDDGQEGGAVVYCHAGCPTEAVVAAWGLTLADLAPPRTGRHAPFQVYDYRAADGTMLYQTCRYDPKDFKQRRPDGHGGWIWNLQGVPRVLYRLPELRAAIAAKRRVWIVEGEKDADALRRRGTVATTNVGGAGKWRAEYSAEFAGARVVVVSDRDATGWDHAQRVVASLTDAASVRVVGAAVGKDISDHLAAGKTLADLVPLDADTVEAWLHGGRPELIRTVSLGEPGAQDARKSRQDNGKEDGTSFLTFPSYPLLPVAALYGLPGEFVQCVSPYSEADPAALLVQFLTAAGNCLGGGPSYPVEANRHRLNLYTVIVGTTAKARKGTSWGQVRALFEQIDRTWTTTRVLSGLSSGEGLIWAVRDPIVKREPVKDKGRITGYQENVVDEGVADKRLLVLEPEFANTLRVLRREGNTVSVVVRQAWDHGDGNLRALTKNSQAIATGAYISIIGHITRDELLRELQQSETANGFANRFLFVFAKRARLLPEGAALPPNALDTVAPFLTRALSTARGVTTLQRDPAARDLWASSYPQLSAGRPGLVGAITSRAEAQVLRLSCLYAVLDGSAVVKEPHLRAALALWSYCETSARFIFGESLGNPVADEILTALRQSPTKSLNRTELHNLFHRNRTARELSTALQLLYEIDLIEMKYIGINDTAGRPEERWCLRGIEATKETQNGGGDAQN